MNFRLFSFPTSRRKACALAFIFLPALVSQAEVRKAEAAMTGDQVLKLVRMSEALQDLKHLNGILRNDETGKKIPFDLSMADASIRFVFKDPNEIINLDLNKNSPTLRRITAGSKVEVPKSMGGEPVRDTHINFEDLS